VQPQRAASEISIFLTGHHPAFSYINQLSVAATDQQQRSLIPAHKNNPPNSKRSLKGYKIWHWKAARQEYRFF
jgi:hypothetical protein